MICIGRLVGGHTLALQHGSLRVTLRFLHFLLKLKPFDEFCPCKNVIANLCVYLVCVHPLNKDVSQAIIGTFFSAIMFKRL